MSDSVWIIETRSPREDWTPVCHWASLGRAIAENKAAKEMEREKAIKGCDEYRAVEYRRVQP